MTKRMVFMMAASLLAVIATSAIGSPALADNVRDGQWHLSYLEIAKAHRLSQGDGITVAVIDTGVNADHPDLKSNIVTGFDVVAGGRRDGRGDSDGHGTGMAGLVAAHGHGPGGGDGALGVAPKAKILPIRIDTGDGIGTGDAMAIAVDEAIKRGANIISISVGTNTTAYESIQHAIDAGVIVVAAAGNRPKETRIGDPGSYPGVVAVGAVGKDGKVAEVSVRGKAMVLTAPGVDVVTTNKGGGTGYRISTGTSPSAAVVAGAAALVWSKYPDLTGQRVVEHLIGTATDRGAPGRDEEYGFGVVNPLRALSTTPKRASASPVVTGNQLPPRSSPAPSTRERGVDTDLLLGAGAGVIALLAIVVGVLVSRTRRRP